MTSQSRIRLSVPEEPMPRRALMPKTHAFRWCSRFDGSETSPCVSIFMTQHAYVRCCAHAGSDLSNEVGGALVGRWRADGGTGEQFIVVESALPARHTRQGSTYLTFTQDTLVALHDDLDERFPGKQLVGWYHTHPRMGVFLSSYDMWLHEHFFPQTWQVALVIEPFSSIGGFFVRQEGGKLDPHRYFGFYEMAKNGRGSVVYWNNLQLEETSQSDQGVEGFPDIQ